MSKQKIQEDRRKWNRFKERSREIMRENPPLLLKNPPFKMTL